jgi:hypothetical protein
VATQQYQLLGLRCVNFVMPFTPVFWVRNGAPGRGSEVDSGVDIDTGAFGNGVCFHVTATVVELIVGSGVNDTDGEGAGVDDELPPQSESATASAAMERKIMSALGMARTVRRLRLPFR